MEPITVETPVGVGVVWGIDKNKVLVEFDYQYLVEFELSAVERIERREEGA